MEIRRGIFLCLTLVLTACGADGSTATLPSEPASPTTIGAAGDVACPLTIPPDPPFVPPAPYPPEAPDLYQKVWYGNSRLWTMLAPEGEVWTGLPRHHGTFGEKTFWWSHGYPPRNEPPPITVTGRRLDRPGSFETRGGSGGFRHDIRSFMLVGIEIPTAGCWELTATYEDAQLSYVVLIED